MEKEAAQRGEKEAAEATGKQTAPLAKDGEKTAAASGGKEAAAGAAAKPPKPPIARIAPGSLPAAEEAAVLDTIRSIESGTKPSGALGKKWGTKFKNYNGDLPGRQGVESPYKEYRVAPQPGQAAPGPNRIVVNTETGEMYYSWTHYGDTGHPAFVKIR